MSGDSKCSTIHNLFLKFSLNQCYFLCKRENGGVDVVKSRMQSTVTNVISFFIIPYQKRIVLLFNTPPPPTQFPVGMTGVISRNLESPFVE